MHKFRFINPQSLVEALEYLNQYGKEAKIIAGGTDLLIQLRNEDDKLAGVKFLVNLDSLPDLRQIKIDEDYISIGTLVNHAEIASSKLIWAKVSFLSKATSMIGSPQIRNRGTIGGNLINASPAADTVPVMIALDADVILQSLTGSRKLPVRELFLKPYETCIRHDEILTEIKFKCLPEGSKTSFLKIGRRNALVISRLNIAVSLKTDEKGIIKDIRIAPGSVMPLPCRAIEAEKLLIGQTPNEEIINRASKKVADIMVEKSGIRASTIYKKPVIEAITRRAIWECAN
jgi:carbon-monoxide dehydrogenase medium subunit/xanthine dehydrogenase FAD-binding subunit